MVGLFGYALAGAAAGAGKGLVEEAQALREQRMEELRRQDRRAERMEDRSWREEDRAADRADRMRERDEDRDFRREERASEYAQRKNESAAEWERRKEELDLRYGYEEKADTRRRDWTVEDREDTQDYGTRERRESEGFRSGEAARERDWRKDEANENRNFQRDERTEGQVYQTEREREDRGWRSGEADKDRALQGDLEYNDEGGAYRIRGGKAETVKGEDGEPVRGLMPRSSIPRGSSRDRYDDGSLSDEQWRQRYNDGLKAGGDGMGGDYDWSAVVEEWRAQGLPIDDRLIGKVESGLRRQAKEKELEGDAAKAYVDEGLAAAGLQRRGEPAGSASPAAADGAVYTADKPATPATLADFERLPKGAIYRNPADGKLYEKQ